MKKWRFGLRLLFLFLFVFSFAASLELARADGDGLCQCTFWCEGRPVGGKKYPNGECRSSDEPGSECVCYPAR